MTAGSRRLAVLLLAALLLAAIVGADALAAVGWLEIRQVALQGTVQHFDRVATLLDTQRLHARLPPEGA
jgi:hypothetical protein